MQLTTTTDEVGVLVEARIPDYHFSDGTDVSATGDNDVGALNNLAQMIKKYGSIGIDRKLNYD